MTVDTVEILAAFFLVVAICHTFAASYFRRFASRFPDGSVGENFFHLMGEVEVVFGLWAGILIATLTVIQGGTRAMEYAESLDYTEPLFVFAIMTIAATRPVIQLARRIIFKLAALLPLHREIAIYAVCLTIGPLLGSWITEPAAMTVTALILQQRYFRGPSSESSEKFKYATLAVLFVNVSIGGVLTPFAAPPVLMVAEKWHWGLGHMLSQFGWKAALGVVINAIGAALFSRSELSKKNQGEETDQTGVPLWLTALHVLSLAIVVVTAHHPVIFMGIFLFFMGVVTITREYQDELKLKESLLVAFFLGGLVVLGGMQRWWLQPLIGKLEESALFLGATVLTAFTDNAALTYLGSQVEGVSENFKYALVAGAVSGGGLTVIANAPNPAGYSILQEGFGDAGISAVKLFVAAFLPTLVAMACLWCL